MRNPNREVFEYRGKRTAECYNMFFNPNICHVCKSIDRSNLILCEQCCLISYCSEEHKSIHHAEHAEICTIIAEILIVKPQKDIRRYNDWQQWIQSRKEFMELIHQRLGRPIETYVKQVILWSKSCVVCHQQAELQVCKRCFSANYCNEHAELFAKKHSGAKCDRFMLLLNIDIETISGNTTDLSYKFLPFVDTKRHFEEMLEFCMEHILMQREDLDWLAKDYVLSDYLSGPLTVYSGLQRVHWLNILRQTDVVIHILSPNSMDKNGVAAWEILLHLLPEVLQLIIVLIGPELTNSTNKYELCNRCTRKCKTLYCCTISMVYHIFAALFWSKKLPNMIVGFHTELSEGDTWSETIKAIKTYSCPLLLSFSCERKARKDINKIHEVLSTNVKPILNTRNHFSGLAPHRDLETGDTYFRNEHLLIYDTLHYQDDNKSTSTSCK